MNPAADAETALARIEADVSSARGSARFPATLAVFAGHFPDLPLLPGVHQVALIAALVRRALQSPQLELVGISRCKWTLPLLPEQELDIQARWHAYDGGLRVDGSVHRGGRLACNCRLLLRAPTLTPASTGPSTT